MTRQGSGVRVVLTLAALALSAPRAQASGLVCPIAPIQGPLCQYNDPALSSAIKGTARAEGARWAMVVKMTAVVRSFDNQIQRGIAGLVTYDSTLRKLAVPVAQVGAVVRAATNLISNPEEAFVRVVGTVVEHKVYTLVSDTTIQANGGSAVLTRSADDLARDSTNILAESRSAATVVPALKGAIVSSERVEAAADSALAVANGRLVELGRYAGANGASQAEIVGALAKLDAMRAAALATRMAAQRRTLDGAGAQQELRRRSRAASAAKATEARTPGVGAIP